MTGDDFNLLPHVVLPRQGAQIGDACLALIRQLQIMGIPLVNDLGAVTIARNKFLTHQALTAAGLPCPDTIFVNETPGFFHAVDQLGGYPVVAKQVSERQGDGVMKRGAKYHVFERAKAAMAPVAAAARLALIPVHTNIRHLCDNRDLWLNQFFGAVLAAAAHAFRFHGNRK